MTYKYLYVATVKEYLDFCLELIALVFSNSSHLWEMQDQGIEVGCALYGDLGYLERRFTTEWAVELKEKFGVVLTLEEFIEILEGCRSDYENANGNLDKYFSSASVAGIKIKFFGNCLDNLGLIDFWLEKFNPVWLSDSLLCLGLDLEYSDFTGSSAFYNPFDIDSVIAYKNFNFFAYESVKHINGAVIRYFPLSSARFTPPKFMLFLYHLLWITENGVLYPRYSDKYNAIFKLFGLVLGEIGDSGALLRLIRLFFTLLGGHFAENCGPNYTFCRNGFITINKNELYCSDTFSPEIIKCLEKYRLENTIT